ncbi:hypothetical protein ACFU7X_29370 [Streptomyces chartreusis]|uniref:hypothetical protein n=1 Tax=Streptomyces chartreusis TaxID=1969 RepID=UPI00369596BB
MYRAKDTFWAPDNRRIVKGDLVAPDDPVVEGREDLFEEVVIPQAVAKQPAKKAVPAKKAAASKPPAGKADDKDSEDGDKGGDQE